MHYPSLKVICAVNSRLAFLENNGREMQGRCCSEREMPNDVAYDVLGLNKRVVLDGELMNDYSNMREFCSFQHQC